MKTHPERSNSATSHELSTIQIRDRVLYQNKLCWVTAAEGTPPQLTLVDTQGTLHSQVSPEECHRYHDYTFFPDHMESTFLATASTNVLFELFKNQPDLIARFVAEMIRLDRTEDAVEALKKLPPMEYLPRIAEELIVSIGFMHAMHGVSAEQARFMLVHIAQTIDSAFESSIDTAEMWSLILTATEAYQRNQPR